MIPPTQDYFIAWVFPSFDQQAIARHYLNDNASHYSSPRDVAYTFGSVGSHNVVLASPASNIDSHDTDFIIKDLLQYAPSIRAGFLVSSDAVAPRSGPARVGDIVVGGTLPLMQRGVMHLDAERTREEKRPVLTGESRNVPSAVAEAVRKIRSPQGRDDWQKRLCQFRLPCEMPPRVDEDIAPPLEVPQLDQRKALLGVIASSRQHVRDTKLLESIAAEKSILCFETAAATKNSYPFLVVAGIARYCEDGQNKITRQQICKVTLSYLACLVDRLDLKQLKDEALISDRFQYEPFDLDLAGFRLLRLQRGTGLEPLQCHLFQAYLDDEKLMPYEALSYCWGNDNLTHSISVNGKMLHLTSNLLVALQYLRRPNRDRILWIDAICVDQSNVRERGHQVGHMGQVYKRAKQVLFWLGYVTYDFTKLLSALQEFETDVPVEAWEQWFDGDSRFREIWRKTTNRRGDHSRCDMDHQSQLKRLLDNEWFRRVWIIQEVFNAKRASLGCSEGWIRARTFALAPILLQVEPNTQCKAIIDVMPGPSRKSSWWSQKPDLSTLLWKFRESQATDPRDRVFALLGIASDEPFTSDYSKTDEDVGKDVMEYLCRDRVTLISREFSGIPNLQNRIPSIMCMDLNHFASCRTQLEMMERFKYRRNKPVFLSESAVGYLWYIESPLQEQLMHESSIVEVISDPVSNDVDDIGTQLIEKPLHGGQSMHSFSVAEILPNQRFETSVQGITEPLAAYLKRRKRAKLTSSVLVSARENGFDFALRMLQKYRDDIDVTEAVAIEATRHGPNIFNQFLNVYSQRVMLTRDISDAATGIGWSVLDLLLHEYNGLVRITDALAIDAIQRGPETLQRLLNMYPDQLNISETTILEAIRRGHEMLRQVFQAWERLEISQTVIQLAVEYGLNTFRVLLDERGNQLVPDTVLVCSVLQQPFELFKLLIDRYGNRIVCTMVIVQKAIEQGSNRLKVLLDACGDQITSADDLIWTIFHRGLHGKIDGSKLLEIALDRYGDQITYPEVLVNKALIIDLEAFKVIFKRYGDSITRPDGLVWAAFHQGPDELRIVLDICGDKISCTEKLVKRALSEDPEILEVVLRGCGDNISQPDDLVWTAFHRGPRMLMIALDRFGNKLTCAKELIIRAMDMNLAMLSIVLDGCGDQIDIDCVAKRAFEQSLDLKTLEMLLDRYGDMIQVPLEALNSMLQHGRTHDVEILLKRYGNRDDVLKALLRVRPKWKSFRYCVRSLIVQGHPNVSPWLRVLASAL